MIASYAHSRGFQVTLGSLLVMPGRLLMVIGGVFVVRMIGVLVRHGMLLMKN
ncbi:MAG: hypothetical protein NTY41_11390 [Proteobacteria bacterium]|nr:hypothetical protein [Pseudomonadota bacterium]